MKEYLDPLSKKPIKLHKKIKIFENFSQIEKNLFNEASNILQRNEKVAEIKNNENINVI